MARLSYPEISTDVRTFYGSCQVKPFWHFRLVSVLVLVIFVLIPSKTISIKIIQTANFLRN